MELISEFQKLAKANIELLDEAKQKGRGVEIEFEPRTELYGSVDVDELDPHERARRVVGARVTGEGDEQIARRCDDSFCCGIEM